MVVVKKRSLKKRYSRDNKKKTRYSKMRSIKKNYSKKRSKSQIKRTYKKNTLKGGRNYSKVIKGGSTMEERAALLPSDNVEAPVSGWRELWDEDAGRYFWQNGNGVEVDQWPRFFELSFILNRKGYLMALQAPNEGGGYFKFKYLGLGDLSKFIPEGWEVGLEEERGYKYIIFKKAGIKVETINDVIEAEKELLEEAEERERLAREAAAANKRTGASSPRLPHKRPTKRPTKSPPKGMSKKVPKREPPPYPCRRVALADLYAANNRVPESNECIYDKDANAVARFVKIGEGGSRMRVVPLRDKEKLEWWPRAEYMIKNNEVNKPRSGPDASSSVPSTDAPLHRIQQRDKANDYVRVGNSLLKDNPTSALDNYLAAQELFKTYGYAYGEKEELYSKIKLARAYVQEDQMEARQFAVEQERLAEEAARAEQERQAAADAARAEQERQAAADATRAEQERLAAVERERQAAVDAEAAQQAEKERLEAEAAQQAEKERLEAVAAQQMMERKKAYQRKLAAEKKAERDRLTAAKVAEQERTQKSTPKGILKNPIQVDDTEQKIEQIKESLDILRELVPKMLNGKIRDIERIKIISNHFKKIKEIIDTLNKSQLPEEQINTIIIEPGKLSNGRQGLVAVVDEEETEMNLIDFVEDSTSQENGFQGLFEKFGPLWEQLLNAGIKSGRKWDQYLGKFGKVLP